MSVAMDDEQPAERELITLEDGREAWLYPDHGMIKDAVTGRIVKPPEASIIRTPEQATAMAHSRWIAAREAAELGLKRVGGSESALAAWSNIVQAQGELAQNAEKGRASTEAARFTGQATGFLRDRGAGDAAGTPGDGINIQIHGPAALKLLEMLRKRAEQDADA